jgi:two-component system, NtrC family, response regulator AtoC
MANNPVNLKNLSLHLLFTQPKSTMSTNLKLLIIDDETRITEKLKYQLEKSGFEVLTANTPKEGLAMVDAHSPEVVVLDVMLPGMNGLDVLTQIKANHPVTEVIMMSGYGDMDMVIKAMRHGACDFIRKPFQIMDIQLAVERTSKFIQLQTDLKKSEQQRSLVSRELEMLIEKDFVGTSDAIQKVLKLALKAANDPDVNVLVTGENGTGKEIVSRIIHYASPRSKQPFIPVNSAAIPEQLLESEFFGHVKGAFTDARDDKTGFFELAHEGTLFLDEIADMPYGLQAKLLRAIEEKKIRKVGGTKDIVADVRILSATNRNIEQLIESQKFRIDLYHRINTIEIHIPPLRERREDIAPLVSHFVNNWARKRGVQPPSVSDEAMHKLQQYYFPGNVRELRNMVERAMILTDGDQLESEDFTVKYNTEHIETPSAKPLLDLESNEKRMLEEALRQCGFNQTKAAILLGISRDAMKRKIKKFRIGIVRDIDEA